MQTPGHRLLGIQPLPHKSLAFVANALDRCANRRRDAGWISARLADPQTRTIHIHGDRTAVSGGRLLTPPPPPGVTALLLGVDSEGIAWAACHSDGGPDFRDLRSLALEGSLPPHELGLLAQARSLVNWHARHGFCANCGAATQMRDAGYRRHCPACAADHFPRTDPVAIVAVRRQGRILLGRQSSWTPGMYSALAGFIEPGETIEDAARREVFEEAGVRLGAVHYAASQPWPFPSSLMIGLIAEALDDAIEIDTEELEDVRWFAADEVRQMLGRNHPGGLFAAHPMAIAHYLVGLALQST